jgi:hypothetical protein
MVMLAGKLVFRNALHFMYEKQRRYFGLIGMKVGIMLGRSASS